MSIYKRQESECYPGKYAAIGTKGRVKPLDSDGLRWEFERDVHRIIYSQAFRRLRHKSQVFFFPRNDHVCTRIEHVLHVASAARTVARKLGLNEDLAEAIGLAHDIGHAPFGHEGEKIINNLINDKDEDELKDLRDIIPSFSHEINSLRVVDKIAKLDREPPGLNLTWEVRDGIISHWGEDKETHELKPFDGDKELESIKYKKDAGYPTTLEGCIVRLIDKIVYSGRDLEDAIATEIIEESDVPPEIVDALGKNNGEMIGVFLEDMINESRLRINESDCKCIAISSKRAELLKQLIDFNYGHIYYSEHAERYKEQAKNTLKSLFSGLREMLICTKRFKENEKLKDRLKNTTVFRVFEKFLVEDMDNCYNQWDPDSLILLDFIAGMTDNFAVRSFQELFVPQATV